MSFDYKNYDFINRYNSCFNPSTIHCKNTALVNYFTRYLLQKVLSVYKWNLPDRWAANYFLYTLFCRGYIAIFNTEEFGTICNECELYGYNVFYQPSEVVIANPLLPGINNFKIDQDAVLIALQPDYGSILDLVSVYADLLAMSLETAGINMLNSKTSFIFYTDSKSASESYKKLYDQIASGAPMTVVDRDLFNDDGSLRYEMFTQNVGQNYITDKILNDMRTIENMFNTDIGIPNANTMKRERLITDEVNANNVDTNAKIALWLDNMQKGIDKANEMFGLDLSVDYRYDMPGGTVYE